MRLKIVLPLLLLAAPLFSQSLYTERLLQTLGLSAAEIEEVTRIETETGTALRRHRADLEVKKAGLGRLLLDEDPSMRLVERNLRETAEIEVTIRLIEIRRELQIRAAVGDQKWSRMIQLLRLTRVTTTGAGVGPDVTIVASQFADRLRELQRTMVQQLSRFGRMLEERENLRDDADVRRVIEELQEQLRELQDLLEPSR